LHTTSNLMIHILLIIFSNEKMKNLFINFLQQFTQIVIIIIIICKNMNSFQNKTFEFCYWIIFQRPLFGKKISNTWFVNGKTFVGNTRINKIYISYLKLSFDLWIYIIQTFFQYIIILLMTFNLDIWVHKIYAHKIFVNGS